jgi:hypothetical protein
VFVVIVLRFAIILYLSSYLLTALFSLESFLYILIHYNSITILIIIT